MSDQEVYDQYGGEQPNIAKTSKAARIQSYDSDLFPTQEAKTSKLTMFAVACILYFIGFMLAMIIFDTQEGRNTKLANKDNHRENDQEDFLRDINSWPKLSMAKYAADYPERQDAFLKMWKSDQAGGENGLFREGRTIENNLVEYIKYKKFLGDEAYFKLFSIPVSSGGIFADIWLFNSNEMGESDRDFLTHITEKSQIQQNLNTNVMKLDYFKKNWFYNTIQKMFMKDYAKLLNGYGRIIYYRVSGGGNDPMADYKKNLITSMYEGRIMDGVPHGLGRMFNHDDQEVHIGYYKHGKPSGKMIRYSKNVKEEGLWKTNPDGTHTVKPQKITSFLANTPYPQP